MTRARRTGRDSVAPAAPILFCNRWRECSPTTSMRAPVGPLPPPLAGAGGCVCCPQPPPAPRGKEPGILRTFFRPELGRSPYSAPAAPPAAKAAAAPAAAEAASCEEAAVRPAAARGSAATATGGGWPCGTLAPAASCAWAGGRSSWQSDPLPPSLRYTTHEEEVLGTLLSTRPALNRSLDLGEPEAEELGPGRLASCWIRASSSSGQGVGDLQPRARRRVADARGGRCTLLCHHEARPVRAAVEDSAVVRCRRPGRAQAMEAPPGREADGPDALEAVVLGSRVDFTERVDDESPLVEHDGQPLDKRRVLGHPGVVCLEEGRQRTGNSNTRGYQTPGMRGGEGGVAGAPDSPNGC